MLTPASLSPCRIVCRKGAVFICRKGVAFVFPKGVAFVCPKGAASSSPGLARLRAYPGNHATIHPTPTGLRQKEVSMPQSLSSVYVHLVFSTKNREPFLRDADIRKEMHAYLGGVSKTLDCPPVIVGGVEDHVHLLCQMARTITQSDWVKEIKRVSSIWIKQRNPASAAFAWQAGYGVFSVSASLLDQTREYIAHQDQHHKTQSFQDEYRAFLRKYGLEWDERFVWD